MKRNNPLVAEFPAMSKSLFRKSLCWMMIFLFPCSLLAADAGAAMLSAKGEAWVNGSAVPRSSAIFPGDLVQTKPDSIVHINAAGSNLMILPESMVKFEGNAISLEHGTVTVATSKGMATHVGAVTVSPASTNWTEFEVTDVNGTVQIMARKGDVNVNDGYNNTTLAQGQQTTRDESQEAPSSDLAGSSWQLVRFEAADGTILTPDDRAKYTVEFKSGGAVEVRIDCNRGHGNWQSSGPSPNQLQFTPLALTRSVCSPAALLNDRLATDWPNVRSYVIKDGHLFTSLVADGGQAISSGNNEAGRPFYEWEQTKKAAAYVPRHGGVGGAATAAAGSIMNTPVAIGVGAAVIGGVLTWVLIQGDEPLSPATVH